jgi:hypothetical protein
MLSRINASKEIQDLLVREKKNLACAIIEVDQDIKDWGSGWFSDPFPPPNGTIKINLSMGFSEEDFQNFLKKLDFEYDNGFGCQIIFGVLWCTDSSWFERNEYDGSEEWVLKERPQIPGFLIPPFDSLKNDVYL